MFTYFRGVTLTLGDTGSYSYFRNCIGFLNDDTTSRFTNWTSGYYSEYIITYLLIDGTGSTFFNIDSNTNKITYLIV